MPAALILAYLARLLTSNPRPPGCLLVPAAGVRAVELFSWVSEGSPSMGVEVGEAAVAFGLGGGGKEIEWFIGRRETGGWGQPPRRGGRRSLELGSGFSGH